ncbi:fucose mutarotase-like [Pecten maximus]|uniref:fucose mutarotase-like n=1 Tax=Pecten maximus TaxID=6579 RepID=UPI0014586048|nr:fucose mutarotase-like [Pecten maximus]
MPLKNIPKILSPDLLHVLAAMGHGDEIVLVDIGFPTNSVCKNGPREIRAEGVDGPTMLDAVLELFPLDVYVDKPVAFMDLLPVDKARNYPCLVKDKFRTLVNKHEGREVGIETMERTSFYERCKKAYAIVHTGETTLYGHVILKKGIV